MIVVVYGLPGTGKTYLADKLAAKIGAGHINSDRVRKKMFAERTYSPEEKLSVYDELLTQMREALKQNRNLVIDATFYKDAIRKEFMKDAGNNIRFIEVKADEALVKERLKKTRTDSEADFEVYNEIQSQFEPMRESHLVLYSTDDNITDMIRRAVNYLNVTDDEGADR